MNQSTEDTTTCTDTQPHFVLPWRTAPQDHLVAGDYELRFAQSANDIDRVQRLRFEVFNRELGEGLAHSWRIGRDVDVYDQRCHHLMVIFRRTNEVVGTYRLLTRETLRGHYFYSTREFYMGAFPEAVLNSAVELGRACVHEEHRNGAVIALLWKGLYHYMTEKGKRYLFGCCSVPSLDKNAMRGIRKELDKGKHWHADIMVAPVPPRVPPRLDDEQCEPVEMPSLFKAYLAIGAQVCGGPALDLEFGVSDYLILLDLERVPTAYQKRFARARWTTDEAIADAKIA